MTRDTEQEVNPCRFVGGFCTHCEATERGDCQGWVSSPKREWQGLTDEEIKEIIGPWGDAAIKGYTRKLFDQIEAKLKEKNSGA